MDSPFISYSQAQQLEQRTLGSMSQAGLPNASQIATCYGNGVSAWNKELKLSIESESNSELEMMAHHKEMNLLKTKHKTDVEKETSDILNGNRNLASPEVNVNGLSNDVQGLSVINWNKAPNQVKQPILNKFSSQLEIPNPTKTKEG